MDNHFDTDIAEAYDAGDDTPAAQARLTPMIDRLAALAEGGPALEFAIGTGRVALPLAARGVPVSGIELSQAMIDVMQRKPGAETVPVVQGDMVTTELPGPFAMVFLVYNTIGNLLSQEAQIACFHNAARHLRAGGCFVIEMFVPPLRLFPPGAQGVPFEISPGHSGFDTLDPATQRLVSHHYTKRADGSLRYSTTPARYVWPSELDLMARLAGFTLESRWADWAGTPFDSDSAAHVSVYRLP